MRESSVLSAQQRSKLEGLLTRHRPADPSEERDLRFIQAFVVAQDNPFDRRIPEAHLTASVFLLDASERLLLTFHRRLDLWLQLGGHAEDEREAEAVAVRECQEESGLRSLWFHAALLDSEGQASLLHVDVHRIPAHGEEDSHLHLDLRFLMETATPELVTADERESKGLAWVSLNEAEQRCDESVGRVVRRLRPLLEEV